MCSNNGSAEVPKRKTWIVRFLRIADLSVPKLLLNSVTVQSGEAARRHSSSLEDTCDNLRKPRLIVRRRQCYMRIERWPQFKCPWVLCEIVKAQ